MGRIDTALGIDWTHCELIECVPGKVSGRPVVRGTRIMPEAIVGSYDLGETGASSGVSHSFGGADKTSDRICSRATRAAASTVKVLLDEISIMPCGRCWGGTRLSPRPIWVGPA